jgi:thiol-disulfide isomerase/thioredoxin
VIVRKSLRPDFPGTGIAWRPLGLALLALAGCEDRPSSTTSRRSDQVLATAATATGALAPSSDPPPHMASPPSAPTRSHALCDGDGNAKGRSLPRGPASHVEATGAPRLDDSIPTANGQWTWVNFWAAWCGPCKEEMPRLLGWNSRLAKAGAPIHLVFVSLDDDERQLSAFLDAQPADGVRATLWLPDGPSRASWLKSLRMGSAPELPQQALVAPSGRVRCFIDGAVEDGDFAEIAALVAP